MGGHDMTEPYRCGKCGENRRFHVDTSARPVYVKCNGQSRLPFPFPDTCRNFATAATLEAAFAAISEKPAEQNKEEKR
jgi:hypothetical protein